jgi:hypothetical protein
MSTTPLPIVVCDVAALGPPDLSTVGTLARLALEARRLGVELRLGGVSLELGELIAFAGLDALLLGVDVRGQPEAREEASGVEEERQLDDAAG